MRFVLFGGSGFIGTRLGQVLAAEGAEVVTLSRSPAYQAIRIEDSSTWEKYIQKGDTICFLVPFNMPNKAENTDAEKGHLKVMETLLDECVKKEIKYFLFLSSGGAIYGQAEKIFTEIDQPNPVSAYGKLKLKIEKMLESYHARHGLSYGVARPSNIYSENQNPLISFGAVTTFYYRISNGIHLDVFGDLSICKDYLHLEDLVPALASMCFKESQGIFNLSFGESHTLGEIVEKIEKVLGKKTVLNFHPANPADIHHYRLNSTKAKREIDFYPKINLDQGILRYQK